VYLKIDGWQVGLRIFLAATRRGKNAQFSGLGALVSARVREILAIGFETLDDICVHPGIFICESGHLESLLKAAMHIRPASEKTR
jgi:hypothetical protein